MNAPSPKEILEAVLDGGKLDGGDTLQVETAASMLSHELAKHVSGEWDEGSSPLVVNNCVAALACYASVSKNKAVDRMRNVMTDIALNLLKAAIIA